MTVAIQNNTKAIASSSSKTLKHKRRYCCTPGCTRIVKSQGLCQRHGAKPRKCKISDCTKQAQGNFDGMCKAHFKASKRAAHPELQCQPVSQGRVETVVSTPPVPVGESVYDRILPSCIGWTPEQGELPLIAHLREGFEAEKPPAWHRNEERLARGFPPITNPAAQLEGWERELVWMEILMLTGNSAASFRHLARGWGRDKGFHMVLSQFICGRQGDVERKRRGKVVYHRQQHSLSGEQQVWDEAAANYGNEAYSETLAADLLNFQSAGQGSDDGDDDSLSFNEDDLSSDEVITSSLSGDEAYREEV